MRASTPAPTATPSPRDGKTMGMDLDGPQNDKGLYALAPIPPQHVHPQRGRHRVELLPGQARRQDPRRLHVPGLAGRPVRRHHRSTTRATSQYDRRTSRPQQLLRRQFQGLPLPPGLLPHPRHPGLVQPRRPACCSPCPAPTTRATCRPTPSGAPTASTSSSPAPRPGTPIPPSARLAELRQRPERDADPVRPLPHPLQRRQGRRARTHRRRIAQRHEQHLPQGLPRRPLDRLRAVPQRPADAPRQPALHRAGGRRPGAPHALQHRR